MAANWTFLTNHAHVWLSLARNPDLRLRDIAEAVGITERAVHRIVHDLQEAGYVDIQHEGRRNRYLVHPDRPMRHPVEEGATARDLLAMVEPHAS
jgi:predicted ArsR family transcriptional regulator